MEGLVNRVLTKRGKTVFLRGLKKGLLKVPKGGVLKERVLKVL